MKCNFTLEYWIDDGWYVGKLKEIPSIFSQGQTLEELEENIQDAYQMIIEENSESIPNSQTKEITVDIA
ncbi:type II toxin-antitoxin system HicB family antitoxin [Crocosphaera sp. XPORK-15E]|uniref:type II toxin-antitoxin system HicB family antitoxin n=1 Tax=Crocosphaera sp. XPORK-15E TaxID=3110247 RepID=UPI002B2100EB|nr:type II toxin-antitoxin system HicB family antitoxin [Crocosphaera sp. XPORK-15E]MEA5533041.1 type II toxin-antitoxin system HicB family antitoxin [Crocosphaera sp. XPORK-15E]